MSITSFSCSIYYMYRQVHISSGEVAPDDVIWTDEDVKRGHFSRGGIAAVGIPYPSGDAILHVSTDKPPEDSTSRIMRAYSFPFVVRDGRVGFQAPDDQSPQVEARLENGHYQLTVRIRMEVDTEDGVRDIADPRELDQLEEDEFRTFIDVYLTRF